MGTNAFVRLQTEDRRLVILILLGMATGFHSNHYILRDALEGRGHNVGYDAVRADLAWLEEQGLVSIEHLEGLVAVTLTARGLDVGKGRARVPGVKVPLPGE